MTIAQLPASNVQSVILVGHGSLRAASGAAMIRLAARAQAAGIAPIVAAGFLNYSRPTFAETLARVLDKGVKQVVVQPYFLVPGKFVSEDVSRLVAAGRAAHHDVCLAVAAPFNDHPALAELVLKRSHAALPSASRLPRPAALLIIAHGSSDAAANAPIHRIAACLRDTHGYDDVSVSFLGLNAPLVPQAIDALIACGLTRIVAVPYFLQFGGHAAEDVPQLLDQARARHPTADIIHAAHLGYDPLLVRVIADRVAEAVTNAG